MNLRWRDLTPLGDAGEAHIIGKRRKVRKVFVPAQLWADLIALRGEAGDNDHPFPFTASWAWKIVRRAGQVAGIENAHPHQFRHAFISHLLAGGEEIVRIKEAVGHTSIATTSLYAHASGQKDLTRKLKVK
jgi:integrase/recombinase XerD